MDNRVIANGFIAKSLRGESGHGNFFARLTRIADRSRHGWVARNDSSQGRRRRSATADLPELTGRRWFVPRWFPVSDDVHVVATRIDKSHAHCVDMRRVLGVMAFIGSYGAGSDGDQAVAGMRVPACLSSRLPDIALHVQICLPLKIEFAFEPPSFRMARAIMHVDTI
jgi:hypothetical protein